MQYTLNDVWYMIDELKARNAWHRKRGFRINDIGVLMQTNHLVEETVELQAEVVKHLVDSGATFGGNEIVHDPARRTEVIEEAGHVLAVLVHLLRKLGVSPGEVCHSAVHCCEKNWTTNVAEVTSPSPGQTRRARQESQGLPASRLGSQGTSSARDECDDDMRDRPNRPRDIYEGQQTGPPPVRPDGGGRSA
jgi:hypothetical protein